LPGAACAEKPQRPSFQGSTLEGASEWNDSRPYKNSVVALQYRRCHKTPSKLYLNKNWLPSWSWQNCPETGWYAIL